MAATNIQNGDFATLPHPLDTKVSLSPFKIRVEEDVISKLHTLLELCPITQPTWENSEPSSSLGVSRDWLLDAVKYWKNGYDWRAWEAELNSFPQYLVDVQDDDGQTYAVHFLGLFSKKQGAIPIVFLHGWPGSIVEFLPMLRHLRQRYSNPNPNLDDDLPYHVIVPHHIGFGYSSAPPLNKDFAVQDDARILCKMMRLLGFTAERGGYVVQGGDLGGAVAPTMATLDRAACRLVHVNMIVMPPPEGTNVEEDIANDRYAVDEVESLQRRAQFGATGSAYFHLQGTRPATAGFAIGGSPAGLLAWIGEKMLEWADDRTKPSLDLILTNVSLYWFSGCYATSVWGYKNAFKEGKNMTSGWESVEVPMGYSWFKFEIMNPPQRWRDAVGKVKWFRKHDKGGHFAALEQPEEIWKDVTDFVQEFVQ